MISKSNKTKKQKTSQKPENNQQAAFFPQKQEHKTPKYQTIYNLQNPEWLNIKSQSYFPSPTKSKSQNSTKKI